MKNSRNIFLLALCVFLPLLGRIDLVSASREANAAAQLPYASVHIGVLLDFNSPIGAVANICLSKALSDFYSEHSDYKTRLIYDPKSAQEELEVASAVLELLENKEVHCILGPELSTEATFVAELGRQARVPVISFTGKSQLFSSKQNPYFLSTTPDDSYQAKALAEICQGFEWNEVVIFYEDTDHSNQFVSKLNKAFQEVDIRLAYMSAVSAATKDPDILKELNKLKMFKTRVFLVHMNASNGCRVFSLARNAGMMSEGYVWLIADSLSNFLNSVDLTCTESMQGVLGIRPHVPRSKRLDTFKAWWKKNAVKIKPDVAELNIYGLWAYDTVWALGLALEKILPINSDFSILNQTENGTDVSKLRVSPFGSQLLGELLDTKFEGLTGDFKLVNRQLQPSAFDIFNIIGTGDKTVGYWIPGMGIHRELVAIDESTYSTSTKELKTIIGPGDTVVKPAGWPILSKGKLKVGVPKKPGFHEFVKVKFNPSTDIINVSGFSIDIFLASLPLLPFKIDYDFIPYPDPSLNCENWTYNDLLAKIRDKTYDFVVGDTTILANRSTYLDFTLPYSESGVTMVVRNKKGIHMWIFLKPLRWDLWMTIFVACIFIGVVLRILEHRTENMRTDPTEHRQEPGFFVWFPVAVLAFPERNMVGNKWSRFVLVIWLFVAYILMQSYTAKLSAIFTVDQLQFAFSKEYYVGYQNGAFVKDFMINDLKLDPQKLRNYSTMEEYHDAMSRGGKRGGIDAIVDEIPYMKLLIRRYGSQYRMVGPTYKTGGFGFAFPLGSPLVSYFSRAILNVTEGPNMGTIEQENFGRSYTSDLDSIDRDSPSLTAYNFGGLFIIIASATLFALFCSETSVGQRLTAVATSYGQWVSTFLIFHGRELKVHSLDRSDASEVSSTEFDEPGPMVEIQMATPRVEVLEPDVLAYTSRS